MTKKKVKLNLVGLDGNTERRRSIRLMVAFRRQAVKDGWTKKEIDDVLEVCMSGDHNNLLNTLMMYCEEE